MINTERYKRCNSISDKLLYLTDTLNAIKEHMDLMTRNEDYENIEIQLVNMSDDLEVAVNEFYSIFEELKYKP